MDRQYQDIHIFKRNPKNMEEEEKVIRMVECSRVMFDESDVRVWYIVNGYVFSVTFPKNGHRLVID